MTLESDAGAGLELAYDEAGSGEPPLVLLHGWCCDRGYLRAQLEAFSPRHRTLAFDLRGHGRSPAPAGDYSIERLADDVARSCDRLGVERPFVVGHSMGGMVALALAAQRPDGVRGIALLDSPILLMPSLSAAIEGGSALLHTDRQREVLWQLGSELFFEPGDGDGEPAQHGTAGSARERILDAMCATPSHVVGACWDAMFAFDAEAAAKRCRAPALYLAAERPLCDLERARTVWPELAVVLTPGVGHFHQIFAAERVNRALERFLGEQLADDSAG